MEKLKMNSFEVVGISVRTSNQDGKAKKDIGELWGKFMSENMYEKIPNVTDQTIYAVYTDYEGDHTKPYTTILGYRVHNLEEIPEGMVGKKIESASYHKFIAKGDLTDNAVIDQWKKIWDMDMKRTYTSDFETYGEKAIDPTNGETEIYISTY
ncbi:GyrI-like domain-containing protein [Aquimarina sediminis]|uniref:GyrI-like domain-containing protein n=1 Tax=Aquimarina sediminis TaxID=2070536 RepID=UPI000CA08412|nr:effector binding domain-containing protein [Aquimarina sediminis]